MWVTAVDKRTKRSEGGNGYNTTHLYPQLTRRFPQRDTGKSRLWPALLPDFHSFPPRLLLLPLYIQIPFPSGPLPH